VEVTRQSVRGRDAVRQRVITGTWRSGVDAAAAGAAAHGMTAIATR